jgi:integrase
MNVVRIGNVSRTPVIELEGMGEVARVGEDFDQAPWPTGVTLEQSFSAYLREHVALKPKTPKRIANDLKRASQSARDAFRILDPQTLVESLTRNHGRIYSQQRTVDGVSGASARRELSVISAAIFHAKKEGRIATAPALWKPEPASPRVMFLTPEDYGRLMRLPMTRRMRIFWLLAFGTGARSEAIQELTWDRIDWERKVVDYRVPNTVYKNKRRVVAPLNSKLLERLRNFYELRDPSDPYVIGKGRPRTNAFATVYHEASRCIKALGIYKPGMARHTFVTWLLQERVRIERVAQLIGDNVSMVERTYGHLAPEDLADDTERVLNVLGRMTA